MPWTIQKRNGKFCVIKDGDSSPVPGGCHATRTQARAHQRALYASERKRSPMSGNTGTNDSDKLTGVTGTFSNAFTNTAHSAASAAEVLIHTASTGLTTEQIEGGAIALLTLAAAADQPSSLRWLATLAFEGIPTSDKRYLIPGKIDERELPLSMMAMTKTDEGHDGAEVAGKITNIYREPRPDLGPNVTAIMAEGEFADNEFGREIAQLVDDQVLRGVSVDLAPKERKMLDPKTYEEIDPEEMDLASMLAGDFLTGLEATIMGATVVPFAAFEHARLEILGDEMPLAASGALWYGIDGPQIQLVKPTLTASAAGTAPLAPPKAWFEMPEPNEPTPLTVTEDGQVYGHLALWDTCHTAFSMCERAKPSKSGYAFFHTGQLLTAEGETINVGRVTVGEEGAAKGGHASIQLGTQGAIDHYDNTATIGAYVRAKDGRLGIWLAGAVRADCPAERVVDMRANPPSGDWRWEHGYGRELVAALCVTVGGFPMPRFEARVASAADGREEVMALVASGFTVKEPPVLSRPEQLKFARLTARAHEALTAKVSTFPDTIHLSADEMDEFISQGGAVFADISAEQRRRYAKNGSAMEDGSYPITKCRGEGPSAENAIHAIGRASNPEATKAHIRKRVRALGCSGPTFENWK